MAAGPSSDGALGIVALPDYDHHPVLPHIKAMAQEVAATLGLAGFHTDGTDLVGTGTLAEVSRSLRSWSVPGSRLVLYWVGHGKNTDAHYYLLLRDSPKDPDNLTALPIETVGQLLGRMRAEEILVLVDACHSGGGADEIARAFRRQIDAHAYPGGGVRPGIAVISSARAHQRAREKVFAEALVKVLRRGPTAGPEGGLWGPRDAFFTASELARALELEMVAAGYDQRPDFAAQGITGRFIANPCHQELIPDVGLDNKHTAATLLPHDVAEHFMVKFRGIEPGESGWHFTGRREPIARLNRWLRREPRGLIAVVGPAGCGKSALLGRLAVLSTPEYREQARKEGGLDGVKEKSLPPLGILDAGVHAKNKTLDECVTHLAGALGLAAPEGGWQGAEVFVERVAGLGRRVTFLVDAVDEAQREDIGPIALKLLRPLAGLPRVRLVVGTRPAPATAGRGDALLEDLAPDEIIDLGRVSDATKDIAAYVRARLLQIPESPYRYLPREAGHVASAVADASGGIFLFARLIVRTLTTREAPLLPNDPELLRLLSGGISKAFEADLRRLGRDERRAAHLLWPLAWAEGAGLPRRQIWLALANALAPEAVSYRDQDLEWLMTQAATYLTESAEDGQTVYRLYHQAFADQLRAQNRSQEDAWVQARIASALITLVSPERQWRHANPYILRHLATHAAAGSRLPRLTSDYGFYVYCDPERLLRALGRPGDMFPLAALYWRNARALREADTPGDRSRVLQKAAARDGSLPKDLLGVVPEFPWKADWSITSKAPQHRQIQVEDPRLVALGAVEGRAMISVYSRGENTVAVWDAVSLEELARWPASDDPAEMRSLAFVTHAGRTWLAMTYRNASVRMREPMTGTDANAATLSRATVPSPFSVVSQPADHPILVATSDFGSGVGRNRVDVRDLLSFGQEFHKSVLTKEPVQSLSLCSLRGDPHLAVTQKSRINLWSFDERRLVARFTEHRTDVRHVVLGVIGDHLAVASVDADGRLLLWEPTSGRHVSVLGPTEGVRSLAIGEINGSAILAAAGHHGVHIWEPLDEPSSTGEGTDARSPSRNRDESSYTNAVYASRTWLSKGVVGDGESNSSHPRDLIDAAGIVTSIALDEHSGVTAVGTTGGLVEVRETATGHRLSLLDTNAGAVTALAFAALHGQRVAIVATAQKTISAWDMRTGRRLHTFAGHVDGLWDISAADIGAAPYMCPPAWIES